MPQDGETPLARMARAIVGGNGFALGAGSLTVDGTAVLLPVLRTRVRPRTHILAGEVPDRISAVDPGQIDRLHVENTSSALVFLPPGSLFEGGETASRGTTAGVVLEPGSAVDVEVRCVHPSRAIRPGVALRLAKLQAPDPVRRVLLSRDQGLVWSVVRDLATQGPSPSDDFVSALTESSAEMSGVDDGQCGLIRLDVQGVVAVEVFDSPKSWSAAARGASRPVRRNEVQTPAHHLAVNPANAGQLAKEFLVALTIREPRQVTSQVWATADSSAECTVVGGEVVHLLAFREGDPRALVGPDPRRPMGQLAAHEATFGGTPSLSPDATANSGSGDADVAVMGVNAADAEEDAGPMPPVERPRRRKVLSSGWDASIFESLERYSRKEFRGDRSAAMRFLVRQGLRRRGYLGPSPPAPSVMFAASPSPEVSPRVELGRAAAEARIRDFERIAATGAYADWLRDRARSELEQVASSELDEALREAAQSALDRLPASPPVPEIPEALEAPPEETVPSPPPLDVRPLLRRAFTASAAGQYADALHLLDEVLQAEPTNRTALLGRAVALRRSGKAAEALAALDLVLRLEPANAAALLNRGRVLQEMGDLRGALETFDRLGAVAPNDWDVWVARGDALARMGRVPDALAAYSEALRRNPDDEGLSAKIRALERARPPPPPSPAARAALPREIQEGQSYLVREPRPDLGYRVLRSLLVRSVPALVLTRRPPAQVLAEHALQGATVLQLTHEPGEDHVAPTALADLTSRAERFIIENHGRAAILLDGLPLLVESNGFRDTALFIERVNEAILPSHATFFVSMAPGDLPDKEAAILERDLRVLS